MKDGYLPLPAEHRQGGARQGSEVGQVDPAPELGLAPDGCIRGRPREQRPMAPGRAQTTLATPRSPAADGRSLAAHRARQARRPRSPRHHHPRRPLHHRRRLLHLRLHLRGGAPAVPAGARATGGVSGRLAPAGARAEQPLAIGDRRVPEDTCTSSLPDGRCVFFRWPTARRTRVPDPGAGRRHGHGRVAQPDRRLRRGGHRRRPGGARPGALPPCTKSRRLKDLEIDGARPRRRSQIDPARGRVRVKSPTTSEGRKARRGRVVGDDEIARGAHRRDGAGEARRPCGPTGERITTRASAARQGLLASTDQGTSTHWELAPSAAQGRGRQVSDEPSPRSSTPSGQLAAGGRHQGRSRQQLVPRAGPAPRTST